MRNPTRAQLVAKLEAQALSPSAQALYTQALSRTRDLVVTGQLDAGDWQDAQADTLLHLHETLGQAMWA